MSSLRLHHRRGGTNGTCTHSRKNARLKYTIDRMGLDNFKAAVEQLLGYQLAPARPFSFDKNIDDFGWITGEDGKHHFTCFIENGRIQDEPERDFKTGLQEIAKVHKGTFRLTANQHLIVADVATEDLPTIKRILAEYKLDNVSQSGLRLSSSACVAFPTCGLAMAESERVRSLLWLVFGVLALTSNLPFSTCLSSSTRSRKFAKRAVCAMTRSSCV